MALDKHLVQANPLEYALCSSSAKPVKLILLDDNKLALTFV